ncbi:unnamed protein product [Arabidopsis halleri]
MVECPIPEGFDARRVRPSLEAAFKKLGYSGPVSITAYGDQTQTSVDLLRCLSSTGVAVVHTRSDSTCAHMYSDMVEWRGHNPPPATMMIISNQVNDVLSWDLTRLQQRTRYNLFLAYSIESPMSSLSPSIEWLFEKFLGYADENDWHIQYELSSAMLYYCKSCNFDAQSPQDFRKHLSGSKHGERDIDPTTSTEVHYVTKMWGRNYPATPEYATAKIVVWWDMFDCPIPEGYDARRVRPSLEAAFKNLGYSGPVSITAFGDLKHIPDHLLRGLSSTGVDVAHTLKACRQQRMLIDLEDWWLESNPPPATIMVITDGHHFDEIFSICLARRLQKHKHNLFMAYSCRPWKMSFLLTSAEWLWESLLAVSDTRRHFLHRCSESESDRAAVFYCKMCFFDCDCEYPDYKNLDDFRTHLSSEKHAEVEYRFTGTFGPFQNNSKELKRSHSAQYDPEAKRLREATKSKPMRKPFRTGFSLLDNHLRRKFQTCKNE